jgi:hypothetical protein
MIATQVICTLLGIRIESEANGREHWRAKAKRTKDQRKLAYWALWDAGPFGGICGKPPITITLTRIAPRKLDSDNLAGGFKAVRDGIADWLGTDDGHESLTWLYDQRKGAPGQYDSEARIEWEVKP